MNGKMRILTALLVCLFLSEPLLSAEKKHSRHIYFRPIDIVNENHEWKDENVNSIARQNSF